jgi:hypothetical protein
MTGNEIGLYQVALIALFLINGILVPVLFRISRVVSRTRDDLSIHKLYLANHYMPKGDLQEEFKKINHTLETIFSEIKELRKEGRK